MVAQNRTIGGLHVHRVCSLPFSEDEVKTLLMLTTQVAFHIENGHLLEEVRALFQRSLEAFSTALDFKDNETGGHSQRVVAYTLEVSRQLGVSGADLDVIGQGALLHDIGKIAVPDRVLLKPGKLSDEEWMIMRKHPETGYQMLKTIQIPEPIATIVRHHHERFDGAGYPLGLRGNHIAQGARIFAVADLYDAMTSDRPYRKALPMDRVIAELTRASGTQLDPDVVRAFFAIPPSVLAQVRTAVQDGLLNRRIA
jgi:putative nucleotidyltransferase with HDIG domain